MEVNNGCQPVFEIGGKKIEIYTSPSPNRPIIYLNTVSCEGGKVYRALGFSDLEGYMKL